MDEAQETRAAYERQGRRWQDESYRSWTPGNLFVHQEAERVMLGLLRRRGLLPLDDREILDVGCGSGKQLIRFVARGTPPEQLHGVDLQEDLLETARRLAPQADFQQANATALPFEDRSFDLVLAFTMLSSMRSTESREKAAREMMRVVRPGGGVLVYDFWLNPRNPDVQSIPRKELRRLFAGWHIDSRRVTLAPPLARNLAPRSWVACTVLGAVPLLRTHNLALISPPEPAG